MKEIVTAHTDVKNLHKTKQPPELQIHAAATLVSAGDPFATNPADRQDKAGEVCQFAVSIPPQFVGRLNNAHLEQAFFNLRMHITQKLRDHGVMKAGE